VVYCLRDFSYGNSPGLKVALVHDWLNQVGGAERVLETLVDLYPGAPVYTSIYWPQAMPNAYRTWNIRTAWLDRLPLVHRRHQWYLPFYPLAFESFDFSGYDLVLSNKSGFCHGVITPPDATHVCYCLAPTRYLWTYEAYARREGLSPAASVALAPMLAWLRVWDRLAAERVDHFVAISREVQARIRKYYGRTSTIIHPPVDTARFAAQPPAAPDDYYLIVSRLIPYKAIDLAVRAFNALKLPLWIGGDGRDRAALEALAGPTVRFLGAVPPADLPGLMARCRAFVFPGYEDFGIAPLEAMAAGRPVIAYAAGGALDTVVDGATGVFFREPTPESLAAAVERFRACSFDPAAIRAHARTFDRGVFETKMKEFLQSVLSF
jgi:glycosyltransferase involved in cell wall biosynthesis